jgi:lipoprotein-releasing system ATP-binding protein
MTALLEGRNLAKSYHSDGRKVEVLRNLDITVNQGEMVSIVGSSGVGKSTLMHLLGTLDVPDEGTVFLEGRDLFALDETERMRSRNQTIGFIFQFHHLLPEFSALENVAMPLLIARKPEAEAMERARKILSELGLAGRIEHRPAQLSGGAAGSVARAGDFSLGPRRRAYGTSIPAPAAISGCEKLPQDWPHVSSPTAGPSLPSATACSTWRTGSSLSARVLRRESRKFGILEE